MEKLNDIGEDALIKRLTAGFELGPDVIAGPGDDCAVLESDDPEIFRLLKVDSVIEGVHFTGDTQAEVAGWKAMCRPLSDFAAMGGGTPETALISVGAPPDYPVNRLEALYLGMKSAAKEFGVSIVGGESVSLPEGNALSLSVFVTGFIRKAHCVFRSGAQVGNAIAVSGELGGSLTSGKHLSFWPRIEEAKSLASWGMPKVTAMMDLSDGIARDLPRLAEASGVGFRVDFDKVPCRKGSDLKGALTDGEDYELLFTIEPAFRDHWFLEFQKVYPKTPLTVIGEITETVETPLDGGWDHFSNNP